MSRCLVITKQTRKFFRNNEIPGRERSAKQFVLTVPKDTLIQRFMVFPIIQLKR